MADRSIPLRSRSIFKSGLSFEQLRNRSHINEPVKQAGDAEDFSDRIRLTLPTIAR